MANRTFDPSKVTFSFKKTIITGFQNGTFIEIDRVNDMFTTNVGADGFGVFTKTNDTSATVQVTLQGAAPSNTVLSLLANLDEATNLGFGSILVKDVLGFTTFAAETARIAKIPTAGFGTDVRTTVWTFLCLDTKFTNGGNLL